MKELLKEWHDLLHACLVEHGTTWEQDKVYAARHYSLKSDGSYYVFDPPSVSNKRNIEATIRNYLDTNARFNDTAPISVNNLPIIWAKVMEIGVELPMAWLIVINSNHELYQTVIGDSNSYWVPVTNGIIISFVLKKLLK